MLMMHYGVITMLADIIHQAGRAARVVIYVARLLK